jgi:uncharacterized membrane protein YbhN (UPF0104 family)
VPNVKVAARRLRAVRWGWVAAAVVGGFLAVAVWSQWREVAAVSWDVEPGTIAAASAALGASLALVAWLWALALADAAGVRARRGVRIWFLSNLARYVPGNVWSFVGAVELARREGAPRRSTLAVMASTQLLSVGVALLVGLPVLVAERAKLGGVVAVGSSVLAAAVVAAVLARDKLLGLLRRRYPEISLRDLVPSRSLALKLTAGYALYWVLTGLAFAVFVRGLYPLAAADVALVVAAYAAAYAVGFLSLLTPAGLGVREGVLVAVLAAIMPTGAAVVVAVTSRLWATLVELAGAALAQLAAGKATGGKATGDEITDP